MQSPLLELKNVGKIYVSEGAVAVGIRGVNLAFSKGEFVAVTGKSGSGKSTLLNVISGMDTYEEGELFVEGEPTSHYMQKDWEEYRKKYISFIFQEYNIIESFTVLQNVELALMNISDPRQRREKALALLDRVGMTKHVNHKGSKLSGGQKQRTVIARALAKDSPVILADEPTGNLDSQTSAEIIELLREVSKDKLVIVVTHNFEQVEACATRHIRIFDGTVESDTVISPAPQAYASLLPPEEEKEKTKAEKRKEDFRNGLHLGIVRFHARPKLSVFLCVLMTLSALALALVTSFMADASGLFDKPDMFTHMEGRVVIARMDGSVPTGEEVENLKTGLGAKDAICCDYMLDQTVYLPLRIGNYWDYREFRFSYPAESVDLDGGRYPEKNDEVLISVPVSLEPVFGREESFKPTVLEQIFDAANYTVVGVRYYYDNTKTPLMYFTEEGYRIATALAYFRENRWNVTANVVLLLKEAEGDRELLNYSSNGNTVCVDFGLEPGTYTFSCFAHKAFREEHCDESKLFASVQLTSALDPILLFDSGLRKQTKTDEVSFDLSGCRLVTKLPESAEKQSLADEWSQYLFVAPDIMEEFILGSCFEKIYTQASLFFSSDEEARTKIGTLREAGYVGVVSDEKVKEEVLERLERILTFGAKAVGWVLSVLFLTLFLNLCTAKSLNATKGDVAIMRSMGIPTNVIKISGYVQTFISIIPAMLVTGAVCAVIFIVPKTNGIFTFLHARDYIILGVLLIAVAARLSAKYVSRMFSDSVKKTLKGGNKT